MKPLSAVELLAVWERCWATSPTRQALGLLEAACPELSPEQLQELGIGQRDYRLLLLRSWTFGQQLVCSTRCPHCQEQLELSPTVNDFLQPGTAEAGEILTVESGSYQVRFRLPNSLDLLLIEHETNPEKRHELLFSRCVQETRFRGQQEVSGRLSKSAVKAVVKQMSRADPLADIQIQIICPACGCISQVVFDIGAFFWKEIESWVQGILAQVHILASAYGWRENDILGMSSLRRQMYLAMVEP
jgi:hypothetical protein